MDNNDIVLLYQGQVKLDIQIGDRIFTIDNHNSGTSYLRKCVAMMLAGQKIQDYHRPKYINLQYAIPPEEEGDPIEWRPFLKNRIQLSGKRYDRVGSGDSQQWYAQFSCTISSSSLIEYIDESCTYLFRFVLESDYDENNLEESYHAMAYTPTSVPIIMKITPGTQATLTWTMRIIDAPEV